MDSALRGAVAQEDDTGRADTHPHRLGSVSEEVQQPVTEWDAEDKGGQFTLQTLRHDGVEC